MSELGELPPFPYPLRIPIFKKIVVEPVGTLEKLYISIIVPDAYPDPSPYASDGTG